MDIRPLFSVAQRKIQKDKTQSLRGNEGILDGKETTSNLKSLDRCHANAKLRRRDKPMGAHGLR